MIPPPMATCRCQQQDDGREVWSQQHAREQVLLLQRRACSHLSLAVLQLAGTAVLRWLSTGWCSTTRLGLSRPLSRKYKRFPVKLCKCDPDNSKRIVCAGHGVRHAAARVVNHHIRSAAQPRADDARVWAVLAMGGKVIFMHPCIFH